jgi:putative membrane protein
VKILPLVRGELARINSSKMGRLSLIALMTAPLFYGGLYLWGNEDPYSNLDRVPAALVVSDSGATLDDDAVNYGRDAADELLDGGDFDWHEVSAEDAAAGVVEGEYDFALSFPASFSSDLVSASEDDPARASLVLTTNDTNSYLSTTIAKQAAATVRTTIAEEVGESGTRTLLDSISQIRDGIVDADDGASRLATGASTASDGAGDLASGTAGLADGADALSEGTADVADGAAELSTGAASLDEGADTLADGTQGLRTGARKLASGLTTLDESVAGLPESASSLSSSADQVASGTASASTGADALASGTRDLVDSLPSLRAGVEAALDASVLPASVKQQVRDGFDALQSGAGDLDSGADSLAGGLTTLETGADQVAAGADTLDASAPALASGVHSAATGADDLAAGAKKADRGADRLASGADDLAAGAETLSSGSSDAAAGASRLADGAGDAADGAAQLSSGTHELSSGATELSDALAGAEDDIPVTTVHGRADTAAAVSDPVEVEQHAITEAQNYGAGLAPFFVSLGAWIGIYALFLIFRPLSRRALTAVDRPFRAALAGWVGPALLGTVQMVALFAILTLALGLPMAHPVGVLAFMAFTSVTFAAIVLALNALLGSVGQFLGLILMIIQLVTAGGTFPWQTLPAPLAAVHQLLPMSHAVDGIRQLMYGGSADALVGAIIPLAIWLVLGLGATVLAARSQSRSRSLREVRPAAIGG